MAEKMRDASQAAKDAAGRTGKVHLGILLDESGSMSDIREAALTGVNEFLHGFKDRKRTRVWLALFDYHPGAPRLRVSVKGVKSADAPDLTMSDYAPRGLTPLNDAILEMLEVLDKAVGEGETAFLAIITDGLENQSEVKDPAVVAKAIKEREEKGWGFVYLGADVVAEREGANIGVVNVFNFNKTKGGVRASTRAAGRMATAFGAGGQSASYTVASTEYQETGGRLEDDEDEPHPGPGEPTSGTQEDD